MKWVAGGWFRTEQQWGQVVLCIAASGLLSVVMACQAFPLAQMPTPTDRPALAHLRIEVLPIGSVVYVNGKQRGNTPLNLDIPAGQYEILVHHEGYEHLQRDIRLIPGQVILIADALQGIASPIAMKTQDASGNTGQATRPVQVSATATTVPSPVPQETATAHAGVKAYETVIALSAYPYEHYLKERVDPRYNFKVVWLDRAVYEAANLQPRPRVFKGIVLENQYLKLTFLPELGGRLYQCIFKPTGQNIFYQNAVLKPSYWGPLGRNENWWLAAGGMEWALPVHEHGYEWGLPWTYRIERKTDAVSIILRDYVQNDRLQAEIQVTLPADRAYFVVKPRLLNPTSQPITCQFWLNAALTLGSTTASQNTEFIYPTTSMIVHSTGDTELPSERQVMSWPIYNGRDFSKYRNWRNWLGVFVPDIQKNFAGAYNHDTDLGIVRVFVAKDVPGLKLFAFGRDFLARGEYANDGSEYFEMWAGPCKTFWPEDDVLIGGGRSISWSEIWLPFHRIGGLDVANAEAVAKIRVQGNQVHVGIAVSKVHFGQLQLKWNNQTFYQELVHLAPNAPLLLEVPVPGGINPPGQLSVQLVEEGGATLVEFMVTL